MENFLILGVVDLYAWFQAFPTTITNYHKFHKYSDTEKITPQPLYNTIFGIQANFRVSYPNRVISRGKCISYIGKGVFDSHLGSSSDPCYIQNRVISDRVIKRFGCSCNHSKILTMWLHHTVMSPNDADGMANSVDPDQEQSDLGLDCLPRHICPKT